MKASLRRLGLSTRVQRLMSTVFLTEVTMTKKVSAGMKAEAVERYRSGVSARNIAKDCGVALSTVYDWIGGVERRQSARRSKPVPLVQHACRYVASSVFDLGAR